MPGWSIHRRPVPAAVTGGADFFVSTTGSSANSGTSTNATWSLDYALNTRVYSSATTVGVVRGTYSSFLFNGTATGHNTSTGRVVIRALVGHKVNINVTSAAVQNLGGPRFDLRDVEIWYPDWTSRETTQSGSITFGPDLRLLGLESRTVHCIIHDMQQGLVNQNAHSGLGDYGSVVYNVGWEGSDRPHGHGAYFQNTTANGTTHAKTIDGTVFFHCAFNHTQYFITAGNHQDYRWAKVITYRSGENTSAASGQDFIHSGGAFSSNHTATSVSNNYGWHPFKRTNVTLQAADPNQGKIVSTANRWTGAVFIRDWSTATFTGSFVFGEDKMLIVQRNSTTKARSDWNVNSNFYQSTDVVDTQRIWTEEPAIFNTDNLTSWTSQTGWDANSSVSTVARTGQEAFVALVSTFESKRGHIICYNWDESSEQTIPSTAVGEILSVNDDYEIRSIFFLSCGGTTGTWSATSQGITLAMTNRVPPNWIGGNPNGSTSFNENFSSRAHAFVMRSATAWETT